MRGGRCSGLAVNPNDVLLYQPRAIAENSLGQYQQAKADMERAMRLSPHDILTGMFNVILGDAELGLGHFDAAIDSYRRALNFGMQAASSSTPTLRRHTPMRAEATRRRPPWQKPAAWIPASRSNGLRNTR